MLLTLEIYFCDLSEEMQEQVLRFYNVSSEKDENFDVFPLFILENSEERREE